MLELIKIRVSMSTRTVKKNREFKRASQRHTSSLLCEFIEFQKNAPHIQLKKSFEITGKLEK